MLGSGLALARIGVLVEGFGFLDGRLAGGLLVAGEEGSPVGVVSFAFEAFGVLDAAVGFLLRRGEARLARIAVNAKVLDSADSRVTFAEGLKMPILWSLHNSRFVRCHVRMYGGFYFKRLFHDYNFTLF